MKAKPHDSTRLFLGMIIENSEGPKAGHFRVVFDYGGDEVVKEQHIQLVTENPTEALAVSSHYSNPQKVLQKLVTYMP